MMFEDNILESNELTLKELENPQSVLGSLHDPNGESWKGETRILLRQESPAAKRPVSPEPEGRQPPPIGKPHRNSVLHRRPIVSAIGAMLLAATLGGGYLYLDHAERFQSTDDAFIAARQFSLAPKVSGYITAVPVTDNQHVAAGDVIARIDDRDYRIALAQAEAQVAAAQASIENIDAQLAVQQAQVAQSGAQVQQQQAGLTYAEQQSARYGTLARDGWGTVQNAQQWTSQQRQAEASLKSAQEAAVVAERQLAVLKAQRASAEANLA